jgi:maleate cis-trans isomerase
MIAFMVVNKRVGFLYPDHAAEDDLPWLVDALFPDRATRAEVVHTTIGEDAHTVEALTDTGARWRLRDGASILRGRGAHVAMWACTSGSFVFGLGGARRQADELAEDFGGPASSTSLAFVAALAAIGVQEVAVAASYPEPLAQRFVEFLAEAGCSVVNADSRGIFTAAQVGRLDEDAVLALVRDTDHPRAKAVLVPDTAMHTVRLLDRLEAAVGKPVLTANQVSVWEALRLAGAVPSRAGLAGLGFLFSLSEVASAN